jgi:hypothetical protein
MARIPIAPAAGQLNTGNQTVRTAQIPVQARSATAEGLMAIADTSVKIMKLAAEADDFKNMTEAGIAMHEEQMKFAQFQQENAGNESVWLGAWEKHVESVKNRIAELPLSPTAREQMTSRLSKWATEGTIQVNSEVFRQKGKNAVQSVKNAETVGLQTGNWGPWKQSVEDLRKRGILSGPQVDALELEGNGSQIAQMTSDYKAQRAEAIRVGDFVSVAQLDADARSLNVITEKEYGVLQKQNVVGQLVTDIQRKAEIDPAGAREMLKTFELPDVDRRNVEQFIETQDRTKQLGEMKDIADKVANGQIRSGEDVQFSFVKSPAEQQKIRAEIDALPISQDELALEVIALEQAIDEFDPATYANSNPEDVLKMVGLSARVNRLPDYVKGQIKEKWDNRRNGISPTTKESYVASGLKVINEMVKSKRDEFFDKDKNLREAKRLDYARFEMEMTRMANAIKKVMPENPTPQQAAEVINAVTGEAISQKMMDAFRPIPLPTEDSKLIIPQPGFYTPTQLFPE